MRHDPRDLRPVCGFAIPRVAEEHPVLVYPVQVALFPSGAHAPPQIVIKTIATVAQARPTDWTPRSRSLRTILASKTVLAG